jgi:hypothetical protein
MALWRSAIVERSAASAEDGVQGFKIWKRKVITCRVTDLAIFHSSDRGQRSIYIREDLKYLIKPRSLEDRAHGSVQTSQEKLATKAFNLLHR